MPTFSEHYQTLTKKEKSELMRRICDKLAISEQTWFRRNRNQDFTPVEEDGISHLIGLHVEDLFPHRKCS